MIWRAGLAITAIVLVLILLLGRHARADERHEDDLHTYCVEMSGQDDDEADDEPPCAGITEAADDEDDD